MNKPNEYSHKSRIGSLLGTTAAALLCLTICGQPNPAAAAPHPGGGGFHRGGTHAGAAGSDGAGMHANGGFHGVVAGSQPGFGGDYAGHWSRGFNGGHWAGGSVGWTSFPGDFGVVPYYAYYGYSSPVAASGTWYYCAEPPGYYPYVSQCYSGWQPVPAG
jgi:hypothetical protein